MFLYASDFASSFPAKTSSILSIITTASAALFIACSFNLKGSTTPAFNMSSTFPFLTFIPIDFPLSLLCAALKFTSISIISRPELSAIALGIPSKASAKAFTASCSLPFTEFEKVDNLLAISISVAPAPVQITPSLTTVINTPIASSKALSTVSTNCCVPPLISILAAFGSMHTFNKSHIFIADFSFFN